MSEPSEMEKDIENLILINRHYVSLRDVYEKEYQKAKSSFLDKYSSDWISVKEQPAPTDRPFFAAIPFVNTGNLKKTLWKMVPLILDDNDILWIFDGNTYMCGSGYEYEHISHWKEFTFEPPTFKPQGDNK